MIVKAIAALAFACVSLPAFADDPTAGQMKRDLIAMSLKAYGEVCPCPYSIADDGSECGKHSGYIKSAGAKPLCYAQDIDLAIYKEYSGEPPD